MSFQGALDGRPVVRRVGDSVAERTCYGRDAKVLGDDQSRCRCIERVRGGSAPGSQQTVGARTQFSLGQPARTTEVEEGS